MKNISDLFLDYDWRNAFAVADEFNATPAFEKQHPDWRKLRIGMEHISSVYAYVEGMNDGASWAVVVGLQHPQYSGFPKCAVLESGCDYTGWDCQAGGSWTLATDLKDLKQFGLTDDLRGRLTWTDLNFY